MRIGILVGSTALLCALGLAACGGSDGPTSPSGGGGGGGGTASATMTINANGVLEPSTVTISAGQRVTFVNNHSRAHDMSSDPHPSHEDCPPMAQVGFLATGQSKTSGNFTIARRCGIHDHGEPGNRNLLGTIVIQ